jgi:hypothetical protein
VVAGPREGKLIITVAHCLPYLPPANRARYLKEATYENLIGPIREAPNIWADVCSPTRSRTLPYSAPPTVRNLGRNQTLMMTSWSPSSR